jgi:hypothetical protein
MTNTNGQHTSSDSGFMVTLCLADGIDTSRREILDRLHHSRHATLDEALGAVSETATAIEAGSLRDSDPVSGVVAVGEFVEPDEPDDSWLGFWFIFTGRALLQDSFASLVAGLLQEDQR